ncbi:MAG: hypothetical protein AB1631_13375 [Acidobacteriota bacterium]
MKSILALILAAILSSAACGKKPAYSDIKTDQEGRAVAQNNNTQPDAAAPPETQPQTTTPELPPTPAQTPPVQQEFKPPSFFDTIKGEISDLPNYPAGVRTNVQLGPLQGMSTAMVVLQTKDPVEKIAAFYDRAAKGKGWKVVNRLSDPEFFQLDVEKGKLHEGVVKVKKDSATGQTVIVISRLEKPADKKEPEAKQ